MWRAHKVKIVAGLLIIVLLFGLHSYQNQLSQLASRISVPPANRKPLAPVTLLSVPNVVSPDASGASVKTTQPVLAKTKPFTSHLVLPKVESKYTIQLLGTHEYQGLIHFIKRNRLVSQVSIATTVLAGGRDWYVLTYGRYATRKAALAAVTQLPLAVRKLRPWVRHVRVKRTNQGRKPAAMSATSKTAAPTAKKR